MLNYPPLRYTRPELSALAAKAKAGDSDAFVLLIRGTIQNYRKTAYKVAKWPEYHDDLIQDAILHTQRIVIPAYDPARDWQNFSGYCIEVRMRGYCKEIMGPLSIKQSRIAPRYALPLPETAQGIVEPTRCQSGHIPYVPPVIDALVADAEMARLKQELDRLSPLQLASVLEKGKDAGAAFDYTRAGANLIKHATIKKLKARLHDIHP